MGGVLDLAMESLMARADDPALRTWWQPGWLVGVTRGQGVIEVDASGAPVGRPPSMTPDTATESLQQVVYTLQAVTHSHDPVRFTHAGQPATSVLGVPTSHPVRARPFAQVMSLMNVEEPSADETVMGRRRYTISGTANTAGGTVSVRVEQDGRVIRSGTAHIRGSGSLDRVYPWHLVVDIRGLAKGTYQVVANGPDPSDPSLTVTDTGPLRLH